jgi:ribonuclease HI
MPEQVDRMDVLITSNGGEIAVAAVACTPDGEVFVENAVKVGQGTSNAAEYKALRHAIALANLVGARRPMFLSDSNLVVQQVNGRWAMKAGGELATLHNHCSGSLMKFDEWMLKHVPRERNKRADWLVCNLLGHSRTLKSGAPPVSSVSCEEEGRPGWARMKVAR